MVRASLDLPGGGLTPSEAWEELLEGNRRQIAGTPAHPRRNNEAREALVSGQRPFAAILGCSDSRVPLEIAFDVGFGDIFSVRSAGPTLGVTTVGSLEYAVVALETPLIVVLTHQLCGAIQTARHQATIGADVNADLPGNLPMLIAGIRRSVSLAETEEASAMHAHDLVEGLIASSAPIREAVSAGTLQVRGAVFSIETGRVTPLDR